MRRRANLRGVLTLLLVVLSPLAARAQSALDAVQAAKFAGTPVLGMGPRSEPEPGIGVTDGFVSFIDSAAVRNVVRTRVDLGYNNHRPSRAEFFQSQTGLPETNVDYQEFSTYLEYAPIEWLSVFVETPFRWINPDVNANAYGAGDMHFGFKLCTWSVEHFIATIQLRAFNPTGQRPGLGTDHWSLEPALLAAFQPYDNITLEGEVRYWTPLGGSDFAGDVLRYGLGASFGQRCDGRWVMPVVEAVGWSVLGGKELAAVAPDVFAILDADGRTIVNANLGVRVGYGYQVDAYAGYGRGLTGSAWHRDFVRIEMRLIY